MAISGIFTALSGMNAQRRVIDTAANNIANQLTPGYRRQVVDLVPVSVGAGPAVFTKGTGTVALGVDAIDTRRVLDAAAETRARQGTASAVDAATTYQSMLQVEDVFGEPGEAGLSERLDAFWTSWSDLSDRADDAVARNEVLARADTVADRFRQANDDLTTIEADTARQFASIAERSNSLAVEIAQLNRSIASDSGSPNALLDERDKLASELTSLIGADVRDSDRGQVSISLGGRLLVGNGTSFEVQATATGLEWAGDGQTVTSGPSEMSALSRLVSDTIPGLRSELDTIVDDFVTEVNDLHTQGYGLDGTDGRNFFDPTGTTAATIAISADVDGEPDFVAAGAPELPGPVAPGIFDGRQAQLLGDLSSDGVSTDAYRAMVAEFGIDTNAAGRTASAAQQIASTAIDEAESVSGVNLDEELTTMMAAQRGFEASARILSIVDEMLQTMINMTR
ncbi:MAG: flagellar hook-associated protein FlgK [Ilumatobacter sp.]